MYNTNTIVIADDHPLLLKGLNDFLTEKGYNIIGIAENGQDAYDVIESKKPNIAIIDIQMPHLSGLEIARLCKKNNLPTRLILITFHKEASVYYEAKELMVYGYLLKEFAIEELENCIESVSKNIPYFSNKIIANIEISSTADKYLHLLTPSERKILKLIANDKTNKDIADILSISSRTAEKHRSNIITKLQLEPKTNSLLIWAKENQRIV